MIVEYTRYKVEADRSAGFEEAYDAAQKYLQASPHCLAYELARCVEDPQRYVLRIEWVSMEEHLQGFRKEAGFRSFFSLVQPFISSIEEMQHYQLTAVKGPGGASDRAES